LAVGFWQLRSNWNSEFGGRVNFWQAAVGFCHWRPGPNFIIIWCSGFGGPVGFWQSGRVYRFGSRLLVVVNFGLNPVNFWRSDRVSAVGFKLAAGLWQSGSNCQDLDWTQRGLNFGLTKKSSGTRKM
jgi:hypothetical protein